MCDLWCRSHREEPFTGRRCRYPKEIYRIRKYCQIICFNVLTTRKKIQRGFLPTEYFEENLRNERTRREHLNALITNEKKLIKKLDRFIEAGEDVSSVLEQAMDLCILLETNFVLFYFQPSHITFHLYSIANPQADYSHGKHGC